MNRYTYRYVYTCTFICNLNEERVSSSFYSGKTNEYTDSPFSTFSASTLMVFFPSFPRSVSGCGVICSRFRNGKSILLFRCSQCPPLRCILKDSLLPFCFCSDLEGGMCYFAKKGLEIRCLESV